MSTLREVVRVPVQALMEAEVSAQIGAEHGERNPEGRTAQRNGYRDRGWDTRAGTVELAIPKAALWQLLPELPGRRVLQEIWNDGDIALADEGRCTAFRGRYAWTSAGHPHG